jgi:two-component system, cell cycle sensor histidine kinase and response regulator CckA
MKTLQSHQSERDSSHSRPTSPFPPLEKRSEPIETLLVVDDDHVVRDMESRILRLEGYTVLEASGAAEALRLAHEAPAIHLLITDYRMPEVDGLELACRFRTAHPETPVLMVSGSLPLLRDGTQNLDRLEMLAKPFGLAELLDKVRRLLDAAVRLKRQKPWCCD